MISQGNNLGDEAYQGGVKAMEVRVLEQLEKAHRRGEYARVIYTCEQLLANPAYDPHRAIILFWKGMSHYKAGPVWRGEAISCLREAVTAARNDRPTKARVLVALGMIYAYSGDYVAYEKMLKDWTSVARGKDPNVMKWGASFWRNYGCTLDNAMRFTEAIAAYQKALTLCSWAEHERGNVLHNIGGAHLYLNNLEEARAAMIQAEPLVTDEVARLSRRAEYALAMGDLVTGQQYIAEALLHPSADDYARTGLYYVWAQLLHKAEKPQEAREKALTALDFAVKGVQLPDIHKINMFLRRLNPPLQ